MNTKLHAVADSIGRPIRFFITADQVSDYVGARALFASLPEVEWLIADPGYDATGSVKRCKTNGYGPYPSGGGRLTGFRRRC